MEWNSMENIFYISVRLMSDTYDFNDLKDKMKGYEISYRKKGESTAKGEFAKNCLFRVLTNNFRVKICTINSLDDLPNERMVKQIIEKMESIETMANDEKNAVKRELHISAQIYSDQFGFNISKEFIRYLSGYGYLIGFSSVVLLGN
jgi:hypothetical protein